MNVLVIEDERLSSERLIALLKRYDSSIEVVAQIASVSGALEWFQMHSRSMVDLIFMDIHLEDGDSFQIVNKLMLTTPIIFTTAFDEYMIKAFKVNSVDYLMKPVNYEELAAAIDKWKSLRSNLLSSSHESNMNLKSLIEEVLRQRGEQYKDRFMVTVGTKIKSINTNAIAYFYLEERTVLVVTNDGTALPIDYSLDKLTQLLDPKAFFRINRQFVVSHHAIQTIHTLSAGKLKLELSPKSKQEVMVSGDRIGEFKAWLGRE